MTHRSLVVTLLWLLVLAGCSSTASESATPESATPESTTPNSTAPESTDPESTTPEATAPASTTEQFPDVVAVELDPTGDGTYTVHVTMSSPYDSPARYADAWRVVAPDGTVLGVRELAHDHAGEQPFTRSLSGITISSDIGEVTAEGRDQVSGWGGATVTVAVPD